jgi:hypothetical protein
MYVYSNIEVVVRNIYIRGPREYLKFKKWVDNGVSAYGLQKGNRQFYSRFRNEVGQTAVCPCGVFSQENGSLHRKREHDRLS